MRQSEIIEHIARLDPFPGWDLNALYPHVQETISRLEFDMLFTLHSPSILHGYHQHLLDKLTTHSIDKTNPKSGITHNVKSLIFKHFEHLTQYKAAEFSAIRGCSNLSQKLTFPFRISALIWAALGDSSSDMNYYSKRGVLAGIYTATLLYWYKTDAPIDEVMAFFDRRLDNHKTLINKGKIAKSALKNIKKNAQILRTYFTTN